MSFPNNSRIVGKSGSGSGMIVTRVDWTAATRVTARIRAGSIDAARTAGSALLEHANKNVPYETGRLRNSGKVRPYTMREGGSATVSYNTPYAARLHENPQYRFRGKGRGKWLQLAVQEMAGRIARIMADSLRPYFR